VQREVDPAPGRIDGAGHERRVALQDLAVLEGEAQRPVGVGVQREEDDPGGVAVDPVHHPQPPAKPGLQALLEAAGARLTAGRDDRLARGLGDRHEVVVFVKEHEGRKGLAHGRTLPPLARRGKPRQTPRPSA
jgi:hypothetical protein